MLVTDVVMPGMSGPVLAERVRELRPGIRVVFMSGYTADEVLRQGVLEEQVEFLQKPFTPDHLTPLAAPAGARRDTSLNQETGDSKAIEIVMSPVSCSG